MEDDCEVVRMLFREELSEEMTFNQNFECSERVSCVTVLRESAIGEGIANAKALRRELSWCPFWTSVQSGFWLGVRYWQWRCFFFFSHDLCCGISVPFIWPRNVDRGPQLAAQGNLLCVIGYSCTDSALHKSTASHEGTIHICIFIKTVFWHMPSKRVEEEVSSPNLYKNARHLSSGPGSIILKKRKNLSVNVFRLGTFVCLYTCCSVHLHYLAL